MTAQEQSNDYVSSVESEIEVTLRHPSFGERVFRSLPVELPEAVAAQLRYAEANKATREAIVDLDARQAELGGLLAAARDEEATLIQDAMNELATERAQLAALLK